MIVARFSQALLDPAEAAAFAAVLWAGGGRKVLHAPAGRWAVAEARRPADLQHPIPAFSRSGRVALFNGQLHNRAELASALGLDSRADSSVVYAEAVDAWGDDADQRVVGHYCAITFRPDEPVARVARSPFTAPPLHVRDAGEVLTISSTTRSLFWRDEAARKIDFDRLGRTLISDFSDPFRDTYEGTVRVPLGRALLVGRGQVRELWRYDIHANPPVRLKRDEDYVAAARELLDEGTRHAMAGARKPCIALSGGLDSPLVAVSMLRGLPPGQTLDAFTFGPESTWQGPDYPGAYSREFPKIAALVARYPQIRPVEVTCDGEDFRYRQRDLLRALDQGPASLGLSMHYKAVYEAAADAGCDVLVNGGFGDEAFSAKPAWAAVEFFRTGRWRQLWRLMRENPGDDRPMWHRFIAMAVLPQLPYRAWRFLQNLRPRQAPDLNSRWGVSPEWLEGGAQLARARAAGVDLERLAFPTRRSYWDAILADDGSDAEEMQQAFLQLDGVETRDAAAYRPLVEFCYGVPTAQFARDGWMRWLARRMGEGEIPDEIRLNRNRGWPNVDWHLRLGRIRHELIDEIALMSEVPEIAAIVDLPGLRRALEEFPEEPPVGMFDDMTLAYGVACGISAGRFIAYAQGRNDL